MIASQIPDQGSTVPDALLRLAHGSPVTPVWCNEVGGVTVRIDAADGVRFAKWSPDDDDADLRDEWRRLDWIDGRVPTPMVLAHGSEEGGEWLVTAAIDGENGIGDIGHRDPIATARAVGTGLRLLHDSLDVDDCPFDWSVTQRIARAHLAGLDVPDALRTPPSIDRLVVCHGDPCTPNMLIGPDGSFVGLVDVGALGVADRWADLAVATWSLAWNFAEASPDDPDAELSALGASLEAACLEAYGVEADATRMLYYRRLWHTT